MVKNLPAKCSISGLGRSPGEGTSYPLQYSGLENSLDCTVHGVAKSLSLSGIPHQTGGFQTFNLAGLFFFFFFPKKKAETLKHERGKTS